jgi:hypothetical protein
MRQSFAHRKGSRAIRMECAGTGARQRDERRDLPQQRLHAKDGRFATHTRCRRLGSVPNAGASTQMRLPFRGVITLASKSASGRTGARGGECVNGCR